MITEQPDRSPQATEHVITEQPDRSPQATEYVITEQPDRFYEEEQENYGNYAQDYADMMNANDEKRTLPQSANQQNEIANVSSKSVSNNVLSCDIANFLYRKLGLTIDSGKAVLPIELIKQAEDELRNSGLEGVTPVNSMTVIKNSKEVMIQ